MSRCARDRRVFFVEEPILDAGRAPRLEVEESGGVRVVVPHLPTGLTDQVGLAAMRTLISCLLHEHRITNYIAWYYTPMALRFSDHLAPRAIVYDCMDELAAFKDAPPGIATREQKLLERAAVVFTGGQSLFEAKRRLHRNVHAMPSSVDAAHFARARSITVEPARQAGIPRPRLGFFGVVDERMDLPLLDGIAASRPDWHLVIVGPTAKIDVATLPRRPNIHFVGAATYDELPSYIAGWDVALLPFARNEATRFISPTKTPEYLAAGKPVVSTSIRDVVRPYGQRGLVRIADTVPEFVEACAAAMAEDALERTTIADAFLRQTSWDGTWTRMRRLVDDIVRGGEAAEGAAV